MWRFLLWQACNVLFQKDANIPWPWQRTCGQVRVASAYKFMEYGILSMCLDGMSLQTLQPPCGPHHTGITEDQYGDDGGNEVGALQDDGVGIYDEATFVLPHADEAVVLLQEA